MRNTWLIYYHVEKEPGVEVDYSLNMNGQCCAMVKKGGNVILRCSDRSTACKRHKALFIFTALGWPQQSSFLSLTLYRRPEQSSILTYKERLQGLWLFRLDYKKLKRNMIAVFKYIKIWCKSTGSNLVDRTDNKRLKYSKKVGADFRQELFEQCRPLATDFCWTFQFFL